MTRTKTAEATLDGPVLTGAATADQRAELATVEAGALAIRADQTDWTPDQRAALMQMGVSEDVTEADLRQFMHVCQRRKLDPFVRQIYMIGRRQWIPKIEDYGTVYTIQTSIDAFRLIARRAADKAGERIEYEDTVFYDADGKPHEVWLSGETPPAAVKVVVLRDGKRFPATARLWAYCQTNRKGNPSGQWRTMPDHMLEKCCEALALRKAFPEDLGGIYTDEEMQQADNGYQPPADARVVRGEAEAPNSPGPAKATPAEQSAAAPPAESAPADDGPSAQEFADMAAECDTADLLRTLFRRAVAAKRIDDAVQIGDQTSTLRAYLTVRSVELSQAAANPTSDVDPEDAAA